LSLVKLWLFRQSQWREAVRQADGSQVDSGYFFWSGLGKKSSARGIAEQMLAPVFRRAKIARSHAHRFRHTLATDILARGGTMADVADVLGISHCAPALRQVVGGPPGTNLDDHAVGAGRGAGRADGGSGTGTGPACNSIRGAWRKSHAGTAPSA